MPPVGFELANPANELLNFHALDGAANGVDEIFYLHRVRKVAMHL
jgi:hypothetical protein